MAMTTHAPTAVDIAEVEQATNTVRRGPSSEQLNQAHEILQRADRQLEARSMPELDSWVVEIVRDELQEALQGASPFPA